LRKKTGVFIRFVLDFQRLFLNGRAEEDAPHWKTVERRIQRDGVIREDGNLLYTRDVIVKIEWGAIGPGQMQ